MSGYDVPDANGAFTRALFAAFDTGTRYGPQVARVRDIDLRNIPDDWVPWLVYDLGLEDIIAYRPTLRDVLADGQEWLRLRGTPDGIDLGFSWVQPGRVAQDAPDGRHNWWEFQLLLDAPVPLDVLRRLDGIARLSKAAEDDLFRIFVPDADWRPVRMDEHRADDGWMDDYSGAPRWDGGPLISFGRDTVILSDTGRRGLVAFEVEVVSYAERNDDIRFDRDRFEERPTELAYTKQERDGAHLRASRDDVWAPIWSDSSWDSPPLRYGLVTEGARLDVVSYGTHDNDTWRPSWTSETWAKNNGRSGVTAP